MEVHTTLSYNFTTNLTQSVLTDLDVSLCEAWVYFIRKLEPLDWFATFTFREPVHPEQANRRYYRFIRTLNEMRFGKHYREKGQGVYHVNAMEWQKREVLHFHSLIGGGVAELDRFLWMELWNKDNGFARIFPYDSKGAAGYVSKYVVKGGEIDINLPIWKAEQLRSRGSSQLSLLCSPPG